MASPGQRVATANAPGLSLPFQSTNDATGGAVDRLNKAFQEGFLTTEDVINGLTIRAAQRKTGMAAEGAKQKDLAEDEQLRGLTFRAKKAKAAEEATMGELGAETSEAYARTLRERGGVPRLGELAAGDALVTAETESLKADQALREAHKLAGDPLALGNFYKLKAAEFGEDVDPNASLPEARAKFQAAITRKKEEAFQMEILKSKLESAVKRGEKIPTLEEGLRKEFDNQEEVKTYNKVAPMMYSIQDVVNKESAGIPVTGADDLKLIFSYMKLLDPGSVVRETEFANAQNAAGIPDVIRNVWNRALQGTRLNPAQRKDFLNSASAAMKNFEAGYNKQRTRYEAITRDAGLDIRNVVVPPVPPEMAQPAATAPVANPPTNTSLPPNTVIVTLKDGRKVRATRTPAGFVPIE